MGKNNARVEYCLDVMVTDHNQKTSSLNVLVLLTYAAMLGDTQAVLIEFRHQTRKTSQ